MKTVDIVNKIISDLEKRSLSGTPSKSDAIQLKKARLKNRQFTRILRLHFLSELYMKYQILYLNTEILKTKNTYSDAEKTANLINMFFPNRKAKPEDFIHNQDQLSDEIIDLHREFKCFLCLSSNIGLPRNTAMAFVREVEHGNKYYLLKSLVLCPIPYLMACVTDYVLGNISGYQLESHFIIPDIMGGESKKVNISLLRRGLLQMEQLYCDILNKQLNRSKSTLNDLLKKDGLTPEELKGIPF